MHFGNLSYVVTTLVFALGATAIEYGLTRRHLREHIPIVRAVVVAGLLVTILADPLAVAWKCWAYNPARTLGIFIFGGAIETYLFAALVSIAVSSAVLVWSQYEDQGLPLVRTTWTKLVGKLSGAGRERYRHG